MPPPTTGTHEQVEQVEAMQSIKCMEHSVGARLPFHLRPPRPLIGIAPGSEMHLQPSVIKATS